MPRRARDPSRQGALRAATVVAAYLPLQPLLAWAARGLGAQGAQDLDGLARWTSTASVLLPGILLAGALVADYRRRRGNGPMERWATGAVAGLAVLLFLAALLTLTQALLTWPGSHAAAGALAMDATLLGTLGSVALVAVSPRNVPEAWPIPRSG